MAMAVENCSVQLLVMALVGGSGYGIGDGLAVAGSWLWHWWRVVVMGMAVRYQ